MDKSARRLTSEAERRRVFLMCGLPASGKTTTAERIHASAGGVLIRGCDVYRELGISLPDWVRRTEGFTKHVADYLRARDHAYREMGRRLDGSLATGSRLVIVDAVHGEWAKREAVYEVCERFGANPTLVWCQCEDLGVIRRRVDLRRADDEDPRNEASDLSVFRHIAKLWEDPAADPVLVPIVRYDTWRGRWKALQGSLGSTEQLFVAALAGLPRD